MSIRFLSFILSAVLGLVGCSSYQGRPTQLQPAPLKTEYRVQHDVVFTATGWPEALKADIYQPQGKGPFPAVLVIHGGGWRSGDRGQMESIAKRLAKRGYVAMNVTYRLAPKSQFPAQLQDVQQALRYLRMHATEYQVQPQRVAAFGYSAGAHLAALLGGVGEQAPLGEPGLRIQAVVAGGTPSDLSKWEGGPLVEALLGSKRDEKPEAYRKASPISYVNAGDPPVFLYHGGNDRLVPLDHATDYRDALLAAGVPCELFVTKGLGHITAFLADGKAVDAALDFLDRELRPVR